MKRILVLSRYGNLAASARQRFQLYEDALKDHGFILVQKPLFSNSYLKRLFSRQKINIFRVIIAYIKRFFVILNAGRYDRVWLQYESFPYLPAFTERLLPLFNQNIVCDYDDAIFHKYDDWGNFFIKKILGKKLDTVISNAQYVICGNEYIEAWAKRFSSNTIIIPTVVSCQRYEQITKKESSLINLGWIGSPATWCYVEPYLGLIEKLAIENNFKFLVIGSGTSFDREAFIFRDWSEESEISDLRDIDIGIMPLPNDKWANGKCGYKIIQYMASSIPVIASPVGVNSKLILHNENGYLANTQDDWKNYIVKLVKNAELRKSMGIAAHESIQAFYSLESQHKRVTSLFSSILK